jgi:hypothetical protein
MSSSRRVVVKLSNFSWSAPQAQRHHQRSSRRAAQHHVAPSLFHALEKRPYFATFIFAESRNTRAEVESVFSLSVATASVMLTQEI